MKKILLVLVLIMISTATYAQNYQREGNTFSLSKGEVKSKSFVEKTSYLWKDSKGVEYPIWINKTTGSCFIIRISKNGKEYRYYLKSDICKEICKELKVEYKIKKSENNK